MLAEYFRFMTDPMDVERSSLVYLIDDDASFRTSLAHALQIAGFIVETFSDVEDFFAESRSEGAVLICDMRMPKHSGLDLQAKLKEQDINIPIIFISGESSVNQAVEAMKGGAKDFITKPFDPTYLTKLIQDTSLEHQMKLHVVGALKQLSQREVEAFHYIIEGFGNAYTAEKMAIRVSTLKEHKTNIFKKLGVSNISELIERYKVNS